MSSPPVEANPNFMISGTALHEWVRVESATYDGDLAARSWGGAIDMIVVAALERVVVEVYEPVSRARGRSCSVRRTAVFTADGDDDDDTRGRRVLRVLRDARGQLPHFDAFVPHDDDSSHPAPHSLSPAPATASTMVRDVASDDELGGGGSGEEDSAAAKLQVSNGVAYENLVS